MLCRRVRGVCARVRKGNRRFWSHCFFCCAFLNFVSVRENAYCTSTLSVLSTVFNSHNKWTREIFFFGGGGGGEWEGGARVWGWKEKETGTLYTRLLYYCSVFLYIYVIKEAKRRIINGCEGKGREAKEGGGKRPFFAALARIEVRMQSLRQTVGGGGEKGEGVKERDGGTREEGGKLLFFFFFLSFLLAQERERQRAKKKGRGKGGGGEREGEGESERERKKKDIGRKREKAGGGVRKRRVGVKERRGRVENECKRKNARVYCNVSVVHTHTLILPFSPTADSPPPIFYPHPPPPFVSHLSAFFFPDLP